MGIQRIQRREMLLAVRSFAPPSVEGKDDKFARRHDRDRARVAVQADSKPTGVAVIGIEDLGRQVVIGDDEPPERLLAKTPLAGSGRRDSRRRP